MQTTDAQAEELFWHTVLPTRLGRHLSLDVMGRQYNAYPWVNYVEQQVIECLNRPGREVMIFNIPPQEGKTTYFGMWLPFWYIGRNPNRQMILVAYNDEYAGTWGLRVRQLVEMYGADLFGIGLNKSQQSINNWKTTKGFGGLLSVGIGGGITGNPGDVIFIDDVVKNMQEAGSAATKKTHLEEWDGSIQARFQENTKVFITATRWAEDDLSGEVWARSQEPDYEGIPVTRICLKAIAEPEPGEEGGPDWRDMLGRAEGEHLEGQHSAEFFREKKASVSSFVWHSLYQGDPATREGSMFPEENWGWYDPDERPDMIDQRRCWDVAATENDGDFTAGGLYGKDRAGKFYVLDMRRFRKSTSGVKDEVKRCSVLDTPSVPIRMEQERAGAGKSVVEGYEEDLAGFDFEGVRPDGSKVSRYTNYSDLQQRGHVLLPMRKDGSKPDWVKPFIDEHKAMYDEKRKPRHDDQIDVGAMAVNDMYGLGVIEIRDLGADTDISRNPIEDMFDLAETYDMELAPSMPERLAAILGRQ